MIDKKKYICSVPFGSLEVHKNVKTLCCASWLKKWIPGSHSVKESWYSDEANDIRDSILDGSYRYCDSTQCPFLHQLETFGEVAMTPPIFHKDRLPKEFSDKIENYKNNKTIPPTTIQFTFDSSCNLKCPSCRIDTIIANSREIKEIKATIDEIETEFGKDVKTLYITGSGDPFISVAFRDFLRNFDETKWPKLKLIHLHTNATYWNKKMWDSMKNVHKYVKSCEISIDAATKDTYENKVRLGGNWEDLMDNLKFISTISTIKVVKTSFVVQQKNYKEMKQFYDLMYSIFGNKVNVFFGKITNWGTFTEDDFKLQQIWDENHEEHGEFVKMVNKTMPANRCFNNLQEFIEPKKSVI